MRTEQHVVVYDLPAGGTKVYTSVYDDHEATRQRARCRWLHGNDCNARVMPAPTAQRRGYGG